MFSDLPQVRLNYKFPSSDNAVSRIKATLISGGGDLLSYPKSNDVVIGKDLVNDGSVGIEVHPDGTPAAEDTWFTSNVFSVDNNNEFDLDSPTVGFASIPEAIEDIRRGKVSTLSFFYFIISKADCIVL